MRNVLKVVVLGLAVAGSVALAADGDHDGDEASKVTCQALDAQGHVLQATRVDERGSTSAFTLRAEGDVFAYDVKLEDGLGLITFTDKRSGDKAKVREGDFDIGEKVTLSLETDEAPESALSVECVGVE